MTRRGLARAAALLALLLAAVPALRAQNPDLVLSQAERDSMLANYDQIFPFKGREAIRRGFNMPLPLGFNIGYFGMTQDVAISDLGLGFNAPPQPVSFITFEGAEATLSLISARVDLWVLPFLNFYVMGGTGFGETTVRIATPVAFETTAEFNGGNLGLGVTGAFGFKSFFAVADFNHQWGFSSLLENPVPANIFSARIGRGIRFSRTTRGTLWVGTMFQSLESATNGSIRLDEVFGPGADSLFTNYQNSAWYQALGPGEQALVDNFVQRLGGALDTTTVNYNLNKKVADPWNMLIGGTMDFGRHWGLRAEVGFIGRKSIMLMANYRIKI